jgi:hypothetical protein
VGIFSNFNDDCEGMFSYLGMDSNPQYMAFAAQCEDGHEPSGLSSSMGGVALVQFELDVDATTVPAGAQIWVCGSMNSWCTYNAGTDLSPDAAAPIVLSLGQGFADTRDWFGQAHLNPGTYAYKYQIVPDPSHPETHRWETVPEECGIAWDRGFDRVLTVVSSVNSQVRTEANSLHLDFTGCTSRSVSIPDRLAVHTVRHRHRRDDLRYLLRLRRRPAGLRAPSLPRPSTRRDVHGRGE